MLKTKNDCLCEYMSAFFDKLYEFSDPNKFDLSFSKDSFRYEIEEGRKEISYANSRCFIYKDFMIMMNHYKYKEPLFGNDDRINNYYNEASINFLIGNINDQNLYDIRYNFHTHDNNVENIEKNEQILLNLYESTIKKTSNMPIHEVLNELYLLLSSTEFKNSLKQANNQVIISEYKVDKRKRNATKDLVKTLKLQ